MSKTHTVKNSAVEEKGTTFNVESIKAIQQSLSAKIAFSVGGCLLAETRELNGQAFNLFADAQAGRREANPDITYIPRMDRVKFWKGFASEHSLPVNFESYRDFCENEINTKYEKAKQSKYNRDLDAIIEEAASFTGDFEKALNLWDSTDPEYNYSADFEGLLYSAIQGSIDKTREGIAAMKYPYRDMVDEELDAVVILLDDLEKNI